MNTTGKHRETWNTKRLADDLLKSMLVPSGKRVDLTKGYRK